MLPKINRVKKKKDFEVIFKKGISFKNELFILKFIKNNLGQSRFAFIVSQKISKKATVRNKIRRRLADIIKSNAGRIKVGIDLILITFPGIEKKEFSEIKEKLNSSLIKAKLVKEG